MTVTSLLTPALLAAQSFMLVITHKDGSFSTIPTDQIESIEFTHTNIPDPVKAPVGIAIGYVSSTAINATYYSNEAYSPSAANAPVMVTGIVPASAGLNSDSELRAYIDNNTGAQKQTVATEGDISTAFACKSIEFSKLSPATEYIVVSYDKSSPTTLYRNYVTTAAAPAPGTKGSIFPSGVSSTTGFIDVDKVRNLDKYGYSGSDSELCWACTAAGAIQWWLNDYEKTTGSAYKLNMPFDPQESKCYKTPVMDVLVQAFTHSAGDAFKTFLWFAEGLKKNQVNNGIKLLNESYPDWHGGFLGMTHGEAYSYLQSATKASSAYADGRYTYNQIENLKGLSSTDTRKYMSDVLYNSLKVGPLMMVIGGSHAVSCWGADYIVESDGSINVTHLYIGENDPVDGNVRDGLNHCKMNYDAGTPWFYMTSVHDGGSSKTTVINSFIGLKGYTSADNK